VTEESTSSTIVTFIVRLVCDHARAVRGTVERVRTGEKRVFTGADGIGGVIEQMLADDAERGRPRRGRAREDA
jgi:hypothetical protein